MPGRTDAGRGLDGALGAREQPARAAHLVGHQRAQLGRRRRAVEVGLRDPEAVALLGRQVDAVELAVLAHVADEVGVLEREPEPAEARVVLLGHAEQRRHDPPHRAGRALHVGDELVPRPDPHRRAVEPHRAHVEPQLAQRQAVAAAGVDERAHHRLAGAPRPGRELGLPGVERGAARLGAAVAARAVDDLVGGADVAVERVRGRPDLLAAGAAWPSSRSGRGAAACAGTSRRRG